ncbi:MAG: TonB-dependent receptor, partial [Bacteroidetes bacterium]|nr:TonB-dependent receptor [Bacteroidota bacterium]
MRKLILLFCLISLAVFSKAQSQFGGGGNQGANRQQMNGRFYGKIIDSITGKPIDAASVQLLQNKFDSISKKRKEVIIGGMLTQQNGDFSVENIPLFGQYKLKVTAIGFQSFEIPVSFIDMKAMRAARNGNNNGGDMSAMMNMLDKDLGNIKLQIDQKVLGNVTVTASKPLLQLGIDRKIFNVEKNIVSAGGTAIDVMRNVPSLNVDIDGNVSLRNNAPQIFVDGRPTTMQLDQIPADAIESIEIITNPSAKFDASGGTAGILNIVLKKNKKVGYNGGLRTNIDSRAKVGLGGDINLRGQKLNLFLSANYMQRKSLSNGTTDRISLPFSPNYQSHQADNSTMNGEFGFGRGGFDYFIDNRNTLSASFNFGRGQFKPNSESDLQTDTLYSPVVSSFSKRFSNTDGLFKNLGTTVSYKHNFPKAGQEWTADMTFNSRKNDNTNSILSNDYGNDHATLKSSYLQDQITNGRNKNFVFQSDYSNPLSDKSKLEAGIRAAFNDNTSTSAFYIVDPSTGDKVLQPSSQIDYESTDRVLAAYTTFTNQLKNFGYQLGLRAESSDFNGKLTRVNKDFKTQYSISLFPSVFLSQKMKNDQELQLNYSRRINRPNFWQLSPFIDSSDYLNLSQGNPGLKPEFTNSLEFSYQKTFKNKDNLLLSLYYKNTNNLITRNQVTQTEPVSGKQQIINTYINANSSYVTGLELISKNKITKWWDLTSNFNLFT